jgi:membrane-bound lytic murein transglycosylase B
MRLRWNHAVLTLALAGVALVPFAAAAPQQQTTEPREAPAGTRRDIRQDTRQIRRNRRDIRRDTRQLQAARTKYGSGSPQARTVRRDIRQDKRSTRQWRRDRNSDLRIRRARD